MVLSRNRGRDVGVRAVACLPWLVNWRQPKGWTLTCCRGTTAASAAALLLFGLIFGNPRELSAQATWEYSPYSVKVWLAMDSAAELTPGLAQRIGRAISERAWVVAGATW